MKYSPKLPILPWRIRNGKPRIWKPELIWYRNWLRVFWLIKMFLGIRLLRKLGNLTLTLIRSFIEFRLFRMGLFSQGGKLCSLKLYKVQHKMYDIINEGEENSIWACRSGHDLPIFQLASLWLINQPHSLSYKWQWSTHKTLRFQPFSRPLSTSKNIINYRNIRLGLINIHITKTAAFDESIQVIEKGFVLGQSIECQTYILNPDRK